MFKKSLVLFFLLVTPISAGIWTDSSARFSVNTSNTSLVDYENGIALLQKADEKDDGNILSNPTVKLNKADQDFLNTKPSSEISGKVVEVSGWELGTLAP